MIKQNIIKTILKIKWYGRVVLTKIGIKRKYKMSDSYIMLSFTHKLPDYQKSYHFYDRFLPHFVQYLTSGSTVVDVGANVGDTLAGMVGKKNDLEYICIEAAPEYYKALIDNLSYLKLQFPNLKVHTVNKLVGKEIDNVKLEVFKNYEGSMRATPGGNIRSHTLDRILSDNGINTNNISLIKTDVDGYDYDVIKSAQDTISKNPPLYFECFYTNEEQLNGYKNLFFDLKSKGYKKFSLFDNFGHYICTVQNIEEINDLLNYIYRQNFYDQTTTISYYDVLAFSDKSNKLIKKVIEDYVAS